MGVLKIPFQYNRHLKISEEQDSTKSCQILCTLFHFHHQQDWLG